ncbi:MAG: glycosyltransferase family 4 protein [Flavobacteriales bacterium]|nr:glycosyltransferase family 4 protein [Flavobacteriales bacterium]
MRIAIIHYRLLRKGGLETRLLNYLRFFVDEGHEVHLIVSKVDPNVSISDSIIIHQVNLKIVPKPIRMWFFNKGIACVMERNTFDLSLSLGRTSHQDLVLCPGTHLGYMDALGIRFRGPIDRMNIYLDKLAYRDSKLILAASEKIRDELVEFANVPESKIRILYPPTNTAIFNQSGVHKKAEMRNKYGFSEKKKSLLFVTTGNHLKGYGFLLKLMKELKGENVELVIAGVKPMETQLKNVHYLGYSENVNELMWAADALIHPAIYEAYAQVVSEALLCGLPVIISDKVGAKSVVSPDTGRVVSGFATEDWMNTILEVFKQSWSISPDFAIDNELTVKQHCEKISAFGVEIKK